MARKTKCNLFQSDYVPAAATISTHHHKFKRVDTRVAAGVLKQPFSEGHRKSVLAVETRNKPGIHLQTYKDPITNAIINHKWVRGLAQHR